MNRINNNAFEVNSSPHNKRKRSEYESTNVYMNPALDLLSTEDAICNTTMEVMPAKRSRRSRSCDDRAAFENPALDIGLDKKTVFNILRHELNNVNGKLSSISEIESPVPKMHFDSNNASMEMKPIQLTRNRFPNCDQNSTPLIQSTYPLRRSISFDLSFIEKLDIDDNVNGELYLDDDLNESNIMEIKTITTVKLERKVTPKKLNTNPFLDCTENELDCPKNPFINFPFDVPVVNDNVSDSVVIESKNNTTESIFEVVSDISNPDTTSIPTTENIMPRRLFPSDTINTTIDQQMERSVQEEQFVEPKLQYEVKRDHLNNTLNKQSKILGCDVSKIDKTQLLGAGLAMKLNDNFTNVKNNSKNAFNDKKNKKPVKIFNKIKDVFKHDKKHNKTVVATENPYEVKRPVADQETKKTVTCFENPALNVNDADAEFDEDELESDSSRLNLNRNPQSVTPMKYNNAETYFGDVYNEGIDLSHVQHSVNKKHVRFDTTLNQQKLITGDSFETKETINCKCLSSCEPLAYIDDQIDEYHNELENCFNEKKLISQNIA